MVEAIVSELFVEETSGTRSGRRTVLAVDRVTRANQSHDGERTRDSLDAESARESRFRRTHWRTRIAQDSGCQPT